MASLWSSVALPAIVSTAVIALFNDGIPRFLQFAKRLVFAFKADNTSLSASGINGSLGNRTVLMCVVRCAPSRRLGKHRQYEHQAATELAQAIAPDVPSYPDRITVGAVRFQTPGSYSDGPETFVNIEVGGLIEFGSPLSATWNEEGDGLVVALEEVIAKIGALVDEIRDGAYRRIYGRRRRLDWSVAISGYALQAATNNPMPWKTLTIAGESVGGRATQSEPAQPIHQFGAQTLRNCYQRTSSHIVVRAALRDWLRQSGYWTPEADIERALFPSSSHS